MRQRSVTHFGYNQKELIKLVRNAVEIEAVDSKNIGKSRRALSVKGEVMAFLDSHLTDWDYNHSYTPPIALVYCLMYLMNKRND